MPSVLQTWLHDLPFMQQTTLLTAVRGPDDNPKYSPPKMLLRWFRRCILISALDGVVLNNPADERGGSFTGASLTFDDLTFSSGWQTAMEKHIKEYIQNLDAIPAHFQRHFMHAIEILGYKHPDQDIQMFWYEIYIRLAREMHLGPESEADMDKRLGDNREAWLERSDVATQT